MELALLIIGLVALLVLIYLNISKRPLYTISIVAGLLGVCCATLRLWEKKGLISINRIGKNRFYSEYDLSQLNRVKNLLQKEHINIAGVKNILGSSTCWEIKNCPEQERRVCKVYARYMKN